MSDKINVKLPSAGGKIEAALKEMLGAINVVPDEKDININATLKDNASKKLKDLKGNLDSATESAEKLKDTVSNIDNTTAVKSMEKAGKGIENATKTMTSNVIKEYKKLSDIFGSGLDTKGESLVESLIGTISNNDAKKVAASIRKVKKDVEEYQKDITNLQSSYTDFNPKGKHAADLYTDMDKGEKLFDESIVSKSAENYRDALKQAGKTVDDELIKVRERLYFSFQTLKERVNFDDIDFSDSSKINETFSALSKMVKIAKKIDYIDKGIGKSNDAHLIDTKSYLEKADQFASKILSKDVMSQLFGSNFEAAGKVFETFGSYASECISKSFSDVDTSGFLKALEDTADSAKKKIADDFKDINKYISDRTKLDGSAKDAWNKLNKTNPGSGLSEKNKYQFVGQIADIEGKGGALDKDKKAYKAYLQLLEENEDLRKFANEIKDRHSSAIDTADTKKIDEELKKRKKLNDEYERSKQLGLDMSGFQRTASENPEDIEAQAKALAEYNAEAERSSRLGVDISKAGSIIGGEINDINAAREAMKQLNDEAERYGTIGERQLNTEPKLSREEAVKQMKDFVAHFGDPETFSSESAIAYTKALNEIAKGAMTAEEAIDLFNKAVTVTPTDVIKDTIQPQENPIEKKAKENIQEVENYINRLKQDIADNPTILDSIVLGKDGGVKTNAEFQAELDELIKKAKSRLSSAFEKNNYEALSEKQYNDIFKDVFRYMAVGDKLGLSSSYKIFENDDYLAYSKEDYRSFRDNENKRSWAYKLGNMPYDDYSAYVHLIEYQEKLATMQKNDGQDYIALLAEEKDLLQQISDIQSRNADAGNVDAHTLDMDVDEAKQRAEALEKESELIDKIIERHKALRSNEDAKLLDIDAGGSWKIEDLEKLQSKIDDDAHAYNRFKKIQAWDQQEIFEKATDKSLTRDIPKELEIYWTQLEDSILDTGMSGEEAIEKFNAKAKELGKTFDKTQKKWVDITTIPADVTEDNVDFSESTSEVEENTQAHDRNNDSLAEKLQYLKDIQNHSKFMDTAEDRRISMEEKAWDAGGNNPKSEADSLSKIKKYEDHCEAIEKANTALGEFQEKYESVIITMKDGSEIKITDLYDLDDLKLLKSKIADIKFNLFEDEDFVLDDDFDKIEDELSSVAESRIKKEKEVQSAVKETLSIFENSDGQLSFIEQTQKSTNLIEEESGQMAFFKVQAEEAIDSAIEGQMHLNDYLEKNIQGQMTLNDLMNQKNTSEVNEKQVEKSINSHEKLLDLLYEIKNVNKSYYGGKHNLNWIDAGYSSQEEAISDDLKRKKEDLHSSINLILSENKTALSSFEEEANRIKTSLQPVQDMVNRISSNSSIKYLNEEQLGSEGWYKGYAEAYKAIDDRLGELLKKYELTNEELEEYITLQIKAEKIVDEMVAHGGGVKASGAKNRHELEKWIEKSFARDLGVDPEEIYSGLFGNITDALYEGHLSLFDDEGNKRTIRELSANILGYDSFGTEEDAKRLKEINTILNYIKNNTNEIEATDFSGKIKEASDLVDFYTKKVAEGKHLDYYSGALDKSKENLQELISLQDRLNNAQGVNTIIPPLTSTNNPHSFNEESSGQLAFPIEGVKEASFAIQNAQEEIQTEIKETNNAIEGQIDLFEYLDSVQKKRKYTVADKKDIPSLKTNNSFDDDFDIWDTWDSSEDDDEPKRNSRSTLLDQVRPINDLAATLNVVPAKYIEGYVRSIDDIKEQLIKEGVPESELDKKAQEIRIAETKAISELSDGFIRVIHRTRADVLDSIVENGLGLHGNYINGTTSTIDDKIIDPEKDYGSHWNSGSFIVADIPEEYYRVFEERGLSEEKLNEELRKQVQLENAILEVSNKIEASYDEEDGLSKRLVLFEELLQLAKEYNSVVGTGEDSLKQLLYGSANGGQSNQMKYNSVEKLSQLLSDNTSTTSTTFTYKTTEEVKELTEAEIEAAEKAKDLAKQIAKVFDIRTDSKPFEMIETEMLDFVNKLSIDKDVPNPIKNIFDSMLDSKHGLRKLVGSDEYDVIDDMIKAVFGNITISGDMESAIYDGGLTFKEVQNMFKNATFSKDGTKKIHEALADFNKTFGLNLADDGAESDILNRIVEVVRNYKGNIIDDARSNLETNFKEPINDILNSYRQIEAAEESSTAAVIKGESSQRQEFKETAQVVEEKARRVNESYENLEDDDKWGKITTLHDDYGEDPLSKTKQKVEKTSTDYRTTVEKWGLNDDGELELQTVKIIKDMDKLAKDAENTEAKINKAQAALKNFIATFDNKTLGQGNQLRGYDELSKFDISTVSDIEVAATKMKQLDAEYNTVVQDFRKGSSSMNPFVNAINSADRMGAVIESLYLDYQGLKVQTDDIGESLLNLDIKYQDLMAADNIYDRARLFGELKVAINDVTDAIKIQRKEESLSTKQDKKSSSELLLNEKKNNKVKEFNKFKNQIKSSVKLTDEMKLKLESLSDSLTKVSTSADLSIWNEQFKNFKSTINDLPEDFESSWNKTLSKINKSQRVELDKSIGEKSIQKTVEDNAGEWRGGYSWAYGSNVSKPLDFKKYTDGTEWTGALADESFAVIEQYNNIIAKMKEVIELRKLLRKYENDTSGVDYSEYIVRTKDSINSLISELDAETEKLIYKDGFALRDEDILDVNRIRELTKLRDQMEIEQSNLESDRQKREFKERKKYLASNVEEQKKVIDFLKDSLQGYELDENTLFKNVSIDKNGNAIVTFLELIGDKARETKITLEDVYGAIEDIRNPDVNFDINNNRASTSVWKNAKKSDIDIFASNDAYKDILNQINAYEQLSKTEDRYQKMRAKFDAGKLSTNQQAEFEVLEKTRERYNKTIEKTIRLSKEEKEIAFGSEVADILDELDKKYLKKQAESYDTYEAYLDSFMIKEDDIRYEKIKAAIEHAEQLKSELEYRDVDGYDNIFKEAEASFATLDINLKTGKISVEKYNEEIEKVCQNLKDFVAVTETYASDGGKSAMEDYVKTLDGAKIGKFDEENNRLYYTFKKNGIAVKEMCLEYDKATGRIKKIDVAAKDTSESFNKLTSSLKSSLSPFASYIKNVVDLYSVFNAFKKGVSTIRDLDVSLTEMRKVSDESLESLKRFQSVSFDVAGAIGTTAKQIQESSADYMRLGYSLETATRLAEDANIYANVGDMDIETATEHMVSSIQAWKSEFGNEVEASGAIIDRYNQIGNNFAITSADIGSAMERSAAALKAGGNTLNESLGLITAGNIIQQDAETTANALKILSLRIRGAKTDLEDMGEETDGLASSTSKMRDEIKALTGVDIMLDESTFKSTAQIIQELGAVWENLSDISQAATLEKIAGKNRASTISGLLENYEVIGEVIESAENSDGSALRENQRYLDSIEGKVSQFTNEVQEFWYKLISSETVKTFVDFGTKAVDIIGNIVDGLGEVGSGLLMLFGYMKFNKVLDKILGNENESVVSTLFNSFFESGSFKKTLGSAVDSFRILKIEGVGTLEALTSNSDSFIKTLGGGISKIGKVAGVIGLIAVAATIAYTQLEKHNESIEETAEKADGFINSINNTTSNMSENSATLSSLNSEYQKLSQGVSDTGQNISLSADEYDRYKEIVSQVSGIIPSLTGYFNSQGEQIGFVKGQLSDLNSEYEKYIQNQAKDFLVNGDEDGNTFQDVLNNYKNNKTGETNWWEKVKTEWKQIWGTYEVDDLSTDRMISALDDLKNKSQDEIVNYLNDIEYGGNGQALRTEHNDERIIVEEMLGHTAKEIDEMTDEEFNVLKQSIVSNLESLKNSKYTDMSQVISGMLQTAYSKDSFWELGEDLRDDVTTILSSINSETWDSFDWDTSSETEIGTFVNNIISAISENKDGISDAWNNLFELDMNELSAQEYTSKVNEYMNVIANTLGLDEHGKNQFMISLGFDFSAETGKNISGLQNRVKEVLPGISNDVLESFTLPELEIAATVSDDTAEQVERELKEIEENIANETQKISDWGLDGYKDDILNKTIQSTFGNVDMDNRQIINWTKSQIEESKDALSDIKYYDEDGNFIESYYDQLKESAENGYDSIDTVFGDFIDKIEGYGDITALAFSHIVNNDDGTFEFLGQKTAEEYLYGILDVAKKDGDMSIDHILELDKKGYNADLYNEQGNKIGETYVHGIIAGFNENAEDISKLMHFSGDFGAISIANGDIEEIAKNALQKQMDIYRYLGENAVSSSNDILGNLTSKDSKVNLDFLDSSFLDTADEYISKTNELQIALGKLNDGSLSNDDISKLIKDFPELADETDNLDGAITNLLGNMNTDMIAQFEQQFGKIDSSEDIKNLEDFMIAVMELGSTVGDTSFSIDIATEKTGIENVVTAMQESVSATGLTSESITNLKNRYAELESQGYDVDKMFEETANGIHLNREALNELENAYEDQNMKAIEDEIDSLIVEYERLTGEINRCEDASNLQSLYSQRDSIIEQINDIGTLAAQYEGLTSAYQNWQNVSSAGNERDMYEGVLTGKEEIEEEMKRGWLDDSTIAYLELMSGKDLSTAGIEAQIEAYEKLGKTIGDSKYNVWDFFTTDDDGNSTSEGVYNFFDTVKEVVGETAAWVDENGNYHFDFSQVEGGDAAIAEALGISEELVQIILRAADDAGFEVNMEGAYSDLADFEDEVASFNDRLKELGATEYTFNVNSSNVDDLNEQIEEAKNAYDYLQSDDCNVNVSTEDIQNAKNLIASLVYQKQSLEDKPAVMNIKVNAEEANSDIENTILNLQSFKNYTDSLEIEIAIGDNTQKTQENIQAIVTELNNLDGDIKAKLGLDDSEFQSAVNSVLGTKVDVDAGVNLNDADLAVINQKIAGITPEMTVECGLDSSLVDAYEQAEHNTDGEVKWDNDTSEVDKYIAQSHKTDGWVIWDDDTTKLKKTHTAKGIVYWEPEVSGTAHASGTAISMWNDYRSSIGAYAQGNDWSLPRNENALVNEIGTESIVRDGRWFPIPGGAHVEQLKKGDIIFNAAQTEELIRTGRVISGGGHGMIAHATGTAFNMMNAYSGSSGNGNGRVTITGTVDKKKTNNSSKSNNSSNNSNDSTEDFEESLDWIERKIKDIERDIENLDQTASATYKSWSTRNSALTKEMSLVSDEIDIQNDAYQKYITEANNVDLSSKYKKLVREGKIDLETIEDEDLANKISEYQDFYDKAMDCKDAAKDLKDELAELARQKFDNVAKEFEDKISRIEHEANVIDKLIENAETRGQIVSEKYYKELKVQEKKKKKELEKEYEDLQKALQDAMESGDIKYKSEEWYAMQQEIDSVQEAIIESDTALAEFDNNIRQLKWDAFDRLQEQISNVTAEADFLISLMEDSELYDDNGQLTDTGMATMGLHGQNYNTYMAQADKYAKEIKKIENSLAEDTGNQDLIERRQELIELQRDSILAANDEKMAIRDMVEEGINLELEALQERIDKYKEAQDEAKSLYDYQKNIADQTKEIANLEKQMSAYKGDDSEENKQRIQQIKVQLEEAKENLEQTEMEHALDESQKMLDNLYTEYETILNERLDNVDQLLSDMITEINENAGDISKTLKEEASAVGVTLSDEIKGIWSNEGGANSIITKYGENFSSKLTSVNDVLGKISKKMNKMIKEANEEAEDKIDDNKDGDTKPPKDDEDNKPPKNGGGGTNTPKDDGDKKTIKVGGKIKATGAKIYDYKGDKSGENQAFKNDPIYKVLKVDGNWLQVRHHKLSKGVTGWFKKGDVKAYETGGLVDETGLAWLDGTKKKPEMVLNARDTENFVELTDVLRNISKEDIGSLIDNITPIFDSFVSNVASPNLVPLSSCQGMNNVFNMNFELHDVTNGEQVINYLIKSNRFEDAVKAMTVDRLAGGSKFSKSKYYKKNI